MSACTAKSQYRKLETHIPRKGIVPGHSLNFHMHMSASDLYILMIDLPVLLQEICRPILGIYKSITDMQMSMEIGTEAAQFPEK
jgi:hypothetical protein